ncbi:predicted protein [Verticillium alfalfae VaMs.102]|uniref:Predicted protein n=1 Tax=Verticillium alfalfae (strain VaMs.102 / ATCC MYA-4576 / FGSC 10136) TaxID=526221 RepID=C9SP62_VERA1|nr:predicted protein [Verticillium alfalfae VaMs.102]EEY20577.1 predicted protein [Verticillium alfalfae VaMs.102]
MLSAACNVHLRSWWLLLLLLLAASTSGRPMQVHRLRPARTFQVSARVQEASGSSWVTSNRRLDRAVGRLVWYKRGTRQSRSKTLDTPLRKVPTPSNTTAQHAPSIHHFMSVPSISRPWQGRLGWAWTLCVPSLCSLSGFA